MQVVDPIVMVASMDAGGSWRVDPTGRTLGFLTNGKPNADALLQAIERRLRTRFELAGVVWANKTAECDGPGWPATDEVLHRLAGHAVAVLAASGD